MASWWILWPLVLSGVLLSGQSKSIQDGSTTKKAEAPANANDWKRKAATEGSKGSSSQLLPQGREDPVKKQGEKPPALPTASQEETNSFPKEITTTVAFKGSPKKLQPQTKLEGTETWPWLLEVTSKPSQAPLSTVTLEQDFETTGAVSTGKDGPRPSFKKVTPALAFLDDPSSTSPPDLIDDSGFSTATQNHVPHSPRPGTKSKIHLPLITATSATPQHLDELLSTSQTLVDDTDFSTATQKHNLDSGRPGLNPRAKPLLATGTPEPHKTQKRPDEMVPTSSAFSTRSPRQSLGLTTSGSSATTRGKSPLANETSPLIGKCLLAILLLALVAAIFIVCSGVLAILLWRQKRAFSLGQTNHTEMVCISSLLSAEKEEEEEEEEERKRRHPRVKRVQLLGETASETEADNLTLNSFLPEH